MKPNHFNKARQKLLRMMRMLVCHNYQFRPTGAYATMEEYAQLSNDPKARYTPIFPDLLSTLPLPQGLLDASPAYTLYDEVTTEGGGPALRAKTTYGVVEIPGGRLYSDNEATVAVIAPDNKLIGDTSFQQKKGPEASPLDSALFRQRYFAKPEKYAGTVFNLFPGGGGVANYFHWLIDVLPRLHLLRQAGLFEQIDYFVVPNYKLDFQRETLQMFGIPAHKIIEGKDQLHLQADLLVSSSHPRGEKSQIIPKWLVQFYRDNFLALPSGKKFPPFVYVSRKDSNFRKVTNEDALMDLLRPYGFESFELSKLSLLEKKDLFASAKVIVSASGAGLTNLMYSSETATLVEFFPDGFVNTHYYNMAHIVGMHYHYLICKSPSRANSSKAGQHEHLTVDLAALKAIIEKVVEPAPARQSGYGQHY